MISEDTTLAFYNPKKEVTIQVDASMKGLGPTLIQEGKPVAFASKALQIQKHAMQTLNENYWL